MAHEIPPHHEHDPKTDEVRPVDDYAYEFAALTDSLGKKAIRLYRRFTYKLATIVSPEVRSLRFDIEVKELVLVEYRKALKEQRRQRRIDEDARHDCMAECEAWRLACERLTGMTAMEILNFIQTNNLPEEPSKL